MDDLISRQAAIDAIWDGINMDIYTREVKEILEELPTAEKTGKWNEEPNEDWAGGGAWVCSDCGWGYSFGGYHEANEFKHCPNCGARMEE